jgi:hypothetical protein
MPDYDAAVDHLRHLADPRALEQSGMDACDAMGVPRWNAVWSDENWRTWLRSTIQAAELVMSAGLMEVASRSGE